MNPLVIGNVMSCALNVAEKPRPDFYVYVCSGATTLLGGIPLVIHFGLMGAAYGLMFSAAVYTAALLVGFRSSVYGEAKQ